MQTFELLNRVVLSEHRLNKPFNVNLDILLLTPSPILLIAIWSNETIWLDMHPIDDAADWNNDFLWISLVITIDLDSVYWPFTFLRISSLRFFLTFAHKYLVSKIG